MKSSYPLVYRSTLTVMTKRWMQFLIAISISKNLSRNKAEALWPGITKNPDISTGPLACTTHSLPYSRARGKVYDWISQNELVLSHSHDSARGEMSPMLSNLELFILCVQKGNQFRIKWNQNINWKHSQLPWPYWQWISAGRPDLGQGRTCKLDWEVKKCLHRCSLTDIVFLSKEFTLHCGSEEPWIET